MSRVVSVGLAVIMYAGVFGGVARAQRPPSVELPGGPVNPPLGVTYPFSARAEGSGLTRVGAFTGDQNVLSINLGQDTPGLVYEVQPWPAFGLDILHVVAPTEDQLNVVYLYCHRTGPTSLDHVWHYSYDKTLLGENAAAGGSCVFTSTPTTSAPRLNVLKALPADLATGFTIQGTGINLDATGHGQVQLGGLTWKLYPFEIVDCRVGCGGSWLELHAVLDAPERGERAFGIIYLFPSGSPRVQFGHGVSLTNYMRLPDAGFNATWTAPQLKAGVPSGFEPQGPILPGLDFVLLPGPPAITWGR
jgi:hypothetical protein